MLVLAGAGSGKTRVITHRMARLIRQGIPAKKICAVTFTNKAAGEMRERVQDLLDGRKAASNITIGTFHSLGLTILRDELKALGFPRGFAVYDAADQLGTVREILRRLRDGDRRYDPKAILTRISLAKNAFIGPDDFEVAEGDEYDEITADVYPRYQRALKAFAALDFDDLITETVRLLDEDEGVRDRWASRFEYVMVDEFQDTNRAQLLLVRHLVQRHDNLCVVGDDDQSIYAWRGADPTNILQFEKLFPGAVVVKLEQNYRSTPQILDAANAVIANNANRHDKKLWSAQAAGPRIVIGAAEVPEDEAEYVAEELATLRDGGRRLSDMAVLYRSNVQTQALEEALRERELPYRMFGGQQFYERKEVKDVIAYLRVALSPRDEISLRRIINYPARGIGTTTVERCAAWAHLHRQTLWSSLSRLDAVGDIKPAPAKAVAGFVEIVERLRENLGTTGVEEATRRLIEDIDLEEDIRGASPSFTAAQRRIDNIGFLLRSLARHSSTGGGRAALMDHLRRLSLDSKDDDATPEGGDQLILTTLHGSKGLEFPVVFLVGMEEEIIPHARTLNPQATDVFNPDHAADVSEERRLAYVGITRAQELLYLTRCKLRRKHGKLAERTPSRFLLEIPEELIEERELVTEARQVVDAGELQSFFRSFGDEL